MLHRHDSHRYHQGRSSEGGTIARMATNGTITNRYPLGGSVTADQLEWGPDSAGNKNWIWFIRGDTDGIGRLDPASGNVDTNFTKPVGTSGFQDLAAGPDGRIYITATNSEHIVRLKPGEIEPTI